MFSVVLLLYNLVVVIAGIVDRYTGYYVVVLPGDLCIAQLAREVSSLVELTVDVVGIYYWLFLKLRQL